MSPPMKKTRVNANETANQQRALAQREAKTKVVKVAKARRAMVFLAAIVLPLSLMVLLAIDYVYRPDAFVIEEVRFEGEFSRVDHAEIDQLTRGAMYGNFFTVNLDYLRDTLEASPWVSRVAARREWPATVVVRVFEHKPIMRWQDSAWVTSNGILIPATKQDKQLDMFKELISLGGDKTRAKSIVSRTYKWKLSLNEFGLRIHSVSKAASGAWKFSIQKPETERTEVLLGSEQVNERFERLIRMYEQNNQLLDASKTIDVRYPNGIAIVPSEKVHLEPIDPS